MTVQFPAIQPTSHEFVAPEWPITETRSQGGVRSVRLWGSRPSDAGMVLVFANITQAAGAAVLQAHDAAKGRIDDVSFPDLVFKSVSNTDLLSYLRDVGAGIRWYFVAAPQLDRVPGGQRVTARAEFRAELRL